MLEFADFRFLFVSCEGGGGAAPLLSVWVFFWGGGSLLFRMSSA